MGTSDKRVGIVVLTHNRRDELLRTLDKLVALDERPPICVVDNASSDGSAAAVTHRFKHLASPIHVIRLDKNLGAAARNEGARHLTVPYIAFCDDDTWWAQGGLSRAADLLDAYPSLATITGRVLVGPEERDDPTNARMATSPLPNTLGLEGGTLVAGILAGACMMRRSAFLAAGGYEPRLFIGGEESLLTVDLLAAGWHLAYVPEIVIHHHPSMKRDAAGRRTLLLRNALWCAWLRRPWRSALRDTLRYFEHLKSDPKLVHAVFSALHGIPWVMSRRHVVPPHVEAILTTLNKEPS